MAKIPLGEVLIQNGSITQDQLDQAVKYQQQTGLPLGNALVKLGFATEETVAQALSKQLSIPYASHENRVLIPEPGQNLEKIISEEFAREHCVLPLFLDNQILAVAMADPTNVLLKDSLKMSSRGLNIQSFVATKAQILRAIDEFYRGGPGTLIDRAVKKESAPAAPERERMGMAPERLDLDKMAPANVQEAKTISLVNAILKQALAERASDIHLESYEDWVRLRFRVDGVLYEKTSPGKAEVDGVIARVKILANLDVAERRLPQDGSFSAKIQNHLVDLRVSTLPTVFGEKLVIRILEKTAVDLHVDKLGLASRQKEDFLKAAKYPYGLIFLTGPTGSGKTTTLYTILQTIKTPEKNFLTIEDPVEYRLDGINQVELKPEIDLTYARAIKAFLRQDPDVILVGEVRDAETAETCLRAALTGHLVLSTLHTNDALGAVVRLKDLGIEPFLIGNTLVLVAAQRLVRILCPHCKKPYKPDVQVLAQCQKEAMLAAPLSPETVFYKPGGCEKCGKTGYKGRSAIYEVYLIDEALRQAIVRGADTYELKTVASSKGIWNLRTSGWRKVLEGTSTPEEILNATKIS